MITNSQNIFPNAQISIPVHPVYFEGILDFAEKITSRLNFDMNEQSHIRLALEELFAFMESFKIIEQNTPPINITFKPQPNGISIEISVKGIPSDLNKLPSYAPQKLSLNSEVNSDLSLHLVKKLTDGLKFQNMGREGIKIEIVKLKKCSHIENIVEKTDSFSNESGQVEELPEYSIRLAKDEEAVEISRCAYFTYGHTYEEYIYYPEQIVEMNKSKELISIVAVTKSGTIMGHIALKFDEQNKKQAEIGVLFVHPDYRKFGLGGKLFTVAKEKARELGLESVFARTVTGHKGSQAAAKNTGFKTTALTLALFPRDVNLKKISGVLAAKMSGVIQYVVFNSHDTKNIYPPKRYEKIILKLYEGMNIPVKICNEELVKNDGEDIFSTYSVPVFNVGILKIGNFFSIEKTENWLTANSRRLCFEKLDVLYLYINIEQPGAAQLADFAAKLGYVFSGIAIGFFNNGDALVLQYLNITENPFEGMVAWTTNAKLLHKFIETEWKENYS